MKKVLSFVIVVMVLVTTLWFKVGIASAAGAVVILYLPGVTKQELKDATMFIDSEYQSVYCVLQDADTGKVVCHVAGKDAGEAVQIFLAGRVFSATVSQVRTSSNADQALTCETGFSPGASVTFTYTEGNGSVTTVVPGSTLSEVAQNASALLGGQYKSFTIVSDLQCFLNNA